MFPENIGSGERSKIMSIICPNCGKELSDDAVFCDKCGAQVKPAEEDGKGGHMFRTKDDKYSWVYEMPMGKSFFLLLEVWKVIAIAAAIVAAFMLVIGLIGNGDFGSALSSVGMVALVTGILLVLSLPAYYIVVKANNGKYTVLFEMDDEGVDHTQIKTDMAKALDVLTMGVGFAGGNRSAVSAGALSATGGSLYSKFSKVKRIKAYPEKHTIRLDGTLVHNMVYADEAHFDWVYKFIAERCPNAVKK
jgi:hypothetical protein